MQPFHSKRILVPTDFSPLATAALEYAVEFSEKFGATLVLLYAEPFDSIGLPLDLYVTNYPSYHNLAEEKLRQYARREVPETIPYEVVVSLDSAAAAIVTAANQHDVDLIIMGTHGRRGLRRAFLGSISEEVLKYTERPVLTVCKTEVPLPPMQPLFARVVCPVNGTPISRLAADYAASLAAAFEAQIHLVHVGDDADVDAEHVIRSGDPAEEIIRFADVNHADLLVIGAQHRRFFDSTVVGTTSERLLRFARCPVLTISRSAGISDSRSRMREVAVRA